MSNTQDDIFDILTICNKREMFSCYMKKTKEAVFGRDVNETYHNQPHFDDQERREPDTSLKGVICVVLLCRTQVIARVHP